MLDFFVGFGIFLFIAQYLQSVLGLSPLNAGLWTVPWAVGFIVGFRAAAVMVSVFSIFATLSMLEMKMMGVALSGAILLDATLIRLVMLPAILCLLGDRAWWPTRRPQPLGERVVEQEPAYELAGR